MGERTSIGWTDATFNPWWGCVRVSPGCEHCYAETMAKRYGHAVWGPAKTTARRSMSEAYWKAPEKWNADPAKHHPRAVAEGRRARVFCASMADVFEDHPDLGAPRKRLFALIEATPNLDWLLLTKRPENIRRMVPRAWAEGFPDNVWIGTSVEDQRRADDRVPELLTLPARVRFLSCEPLLGPVELLREWPDWFGEWGAINWCIIGGESGPGARPFDIGWARDLARQCEAAGVATFVKQLGAVVRWDGTDAQLWPRTTKHEDIGGAWRARLRDGKGEDWSEWPEDLRVREWPAIARPATSDSAVPTP